jgi:hypothetical protein
MKNIQQNVRVETIDGRKVSITSYSQRDKSRPYPEGGRGKQRTPYVEPARAKGDEGK